MVSNRVKCNISGTLFFVAILCVIARGWYLAMNPTSGHVWFETAAIALLSYLSFDNFLIYYRRVKNGIKLPIFGQN